MLGPEGRESQGHAAECLLLAVWRSMDRVYTHICICTYIYICIHIHIHMYTLNTTHAEPVSTAASELVHTNPIMDRGSS